MLKLLRFLITGDMHDHEWEIIGEEKVDYWYSNFDKMPSSFVRIYVLRCKKCGAIKSRKIRY
jgi:hypothetical protein